MVVIGPKIDIDIFAPFFSSVHSGVLVEFQKKKFEAKIPIRTGDMGDHILW